MKLCGSKVTQQINVHNTTRLTENNYFLPIVIFFFALKSFSYLGCKIWEDILKILKYLGYLRVFQFELRNILLENQLDKL